MHMYKLNMYINISIHITNNNRWLHHILEYNTVIIYYYYYLFILYTFVKLEQVGKIQDNLN